MSNKIIVETSARHIHLSQQHLEILFGAGATLTHKKDLSQPGQYACEERVTVVGSKKELKNVSILGPTRKDTQVELSLTDARSIGIAAPIKESGDIAGSGSCKLIGPAGEVELAQGVIVAKRHIHFDTKSAADMGVTDKETLKIKITSDQRTLIFDDVVARVNPDFALAMHLDTDESNAAGCSGQTFAEIIR